MIRIICENERILLSYEDIDEKYDGYWVAVDTNSAIDKFCGYPLLLGDSFDEVYDAAEEAGLMPCKVQCASKKRWEGTACLH